MNKPLRKIKFLVMFFLFFLLCSLTYSYQLILEGDLSISRNDNKLEAILVAPNGDRTNVTLAHSNGNINDFTTWSSSNTDVGTVMQNGDVFFSGRTGSVTFTAKYEIFDTGVTYTATRDFSYDPVDSRVYQLEIRGLDYTQITNNLTLYRVYGDDREERVPNDQITWSTSDRVIATINRDGVVVFSKEAGPVTITANHRGRIANASTTYPTEIKELIINESLNFTEAFFTTPPRLTVTARINDGSTQRIAAPVWTSSNTDVATVDSRGFVTLTGQSGTAVITASDSGFTVSRTLTVPENQAITLRSIFFRENLVYSPTGQALQVSALFDNNSIRDITDQVTFSVSNPALAQIYGTTVYYTGLSGNLSVTARYQNQLATSQIFIYPLNRSGPQLSGIKFQKPIYTIADNNQPMVVYGINNDNSVFRISNPSFNVLERNVAEVRNGNLVIKGIPGTATVEASFGRFRDQTTVFNFRPEGGLKPEKIFILSNLNTSSRVIPLVANARYSDGTVRDITNQAVWNVSNTSFAEINNEGQLVIKENRDFTVSVFFEGLSASIPSRAHLFPNVTNGVNTNIVPINRIYENTQRMLDRNRHLPYPPDIRGHWAERILRNGQMSGWIRGFPDGTLRPNQRITRAEFAAFADRIFDLTAAENQTFADTANHWAAPSISKFKALNLYPMHQQNFRPDDPLTREEMADFIAKLSNIRNTNNNPFVDVDLSNPYLPSILKVTQSGIMVGTSPNQFSPKTIATRAQALTVINNLLTTDVNMAAILR